MPSSSVSLNSPPTHTMYDMDLPATSHPSLYHVPYDSPVAASPHLVGTVRPKRKQVKNACSACQRACKRCDVGRPCERCIKYGMADTCRDSQRKERKKGVKRGPYKKRDGMLNDLQRMASPKRMSRVSSISDIDLSSASLIPIDQPMPLQQQSSTYYPAMHAQTPPQSFASMHEPSHATFHQSEEYYTRYDHLQQASARPQYPSTSQDYRQVDRVQDRSPVRLQYPSPEHSPGRERQYSAPAYTDNSSHRHALIQSAHHDVSYQSQSDGHEYETSAVRTVGQYYPQHPQTHQHQPQHQVQPPHQVQPQLQAQHQVQHQPQHQAQNQPQHQVHQAQHQRSYSDGHMADVHQEQYYSGYNSYQQSSSYDNSYYPQHVQQSHQPQQHQISDQNDAYMNRMVPDHYSSGSSSINSYPTQHSQHQMNGTIPMQYSSVRTQGKMVHRDDTMVAQHHQYHHSHHASNVQIQSN